MNTRNGLNVAHFKGQLPAICPLFLSAADAVQIVRSMGLKSCLNGICSAISTDFLRWNDFDKSARVANHSRLGVIELMPVAEFNEVTGAGIPAQGPYETVAGFLVALCGAIPARGDRLRWRDWAFTISETDGRRIGRVRVLREGRPPA